MSGFRSCRELSRQGQTPLGCHQVLHQPVGRGEEYRPARLLRPVAHGAEGVSLAGAGQPESQHVDASVHEAAFGQFPQFLLQG